MTKQKQAFVATVWAYYETHGRHDLPWRQTTDVYRIVVSELMLQQTQVERVIAKYQAFVARFPTVEALATASLAEVLELWQGLGYNRRAKLLHECAYIITTQYYGVWPADRVTLQKLPGIGLYTAGAVMAFAYNQPVVLIETNVRTVFIHHFFPYSEQVTDKSLEKYITATLDETNPRGWYAALMDYGSFLKRTIGNNIKKSRHYKKQSTFKDSPRYYRGAIIRLLTKEKQLSVPQLAGALLIPTEQCDMLIEQLQRDGLVVKNASQVWLPGVLEGESEKHTEDENESKNRKGE